MRIPCPIRNRSGFTLIEVMIASVLVVAMVTAGLVGMRQVNLLTQIGASRTTHSEVRGRIVEALTQYGACASQLGFPTIPSIFAPPQDGIPIPEIKESLPSGGFANELLLDSAAKPRAGLKYEARLRFPYAPEFNYVPEWVPRVGDNLFRYQVELEIKGIRDTLKDQIVGTDKPAGAPVSSTAPVVSPSALYARIPLTADFDANGKMVTCAVLADDIDEPLVAPQVPSSNRHSVRDCLAIDGTPMPTPSGLVCRVPVPLTVNTRTNGDIPVDATCTAHGFTPFSGGAPATVYNTTMATDFSETMCKNRKIYFFTPWHAFGPTDPHTEEVFHRVRKGSHRFTLNSFMYAIAATYAAGLVGLALLLILFFTSCPKEDAHDFPQVTSVGCV